MELGILNMELLGLFIDAETGETIERELNAEEIAELEIVQSEATAQKTQQEAKADARASALAKLADLGLTEEEIAAL
jgi:regulator of protease activity HflC (stomatin/prohibitin superfamily)